VFTGIIQAVGSLQALDSRGEDVRLRVATGVLPMQETQIGDSIAVNGVCLTAIALGGQSLRLTSLGELGVGSKLNLEKALTLQTPLGGHLVSGHVDGVGVVVARYDEGRSVRFQIEAPADLARYIAAKGSITVDGTSLTVNEVAANRFMLNLVPHTLEQTIAGQYRVGSRVNLEVDLVARYLERLLSADSSVPSGGASTLNEEMLRAAGFGGQR
jgi:riboflavin synthase